MSVKLVFGASSGVVNPRLSFPSLFELINLRYPIEDVKSFIESIPVFDRLSFINQIDPTDPWKRTYLFSAACQGNQELVKLLLDLGAEVNTKSCNTSPWTKMTVLHIASVQGHARIVALLLAKGAEIGMRTMEGNTPLHIAAFQGHSEVVALLLRHGALMLERNPEGFTPYELAILSKSNATIDLFFHSIVEKFHSDENSLLQELQQYRGLTYLECFDAYLSLFSYILHINLADREIHPLKRDCIGEFTKKTEKTVNFLLFDSRMPGEIDAVIEAAEQELKGVKENSGGDLELLIKNLAEFRQFLNSRLYPNMTEFLKVLVLPHMIPVMRARMHLHDALPRIEALLQECVSLNNLKQSQNRGFKEAEEIYDATEIFALLSSFGGGVGSGDGDMAPDESYVNHFGCEMEDIYKGRFLSGKDLRAIGVDFYLYHLCEHEMKRDAPGTIDKLKRVISEKIEFLEELKKIGHPSLSSLIDALKTYDLASGSQPLHHLELAIGKMLLRIFFSQGIENVEEYLHDHEPDKSLSDIKAAAHLSILDFFRISQEEGKRKSDAVLMEPPSKSARSE